VLVRRPGRAVPSRPSLACAHQCGCSSTRPRPAALSGRVGVAGDRRARRPRRSGLDHTPGHGPRRRRGRPSRVRRRRGSGSTSTTRGAVVASPPGPARAHGRRHPRTRTRRPTRSRPDEGRHADRPPRSMVTRPSSTLTRVHRQSRVHASGTGTTLSTHPGSGRRRARRPSCRPARRWWARLPREPGDAAGDDGRSGERAEVSTRRTPRPPRGGTRATCSPPTSARRRARGSRSWIEQVDAGDVRSATAVMSEPPGWSVR
jgi:hypothetical protein